MRAGAIAHLRCRRLLLSILPPAVRAAHTSPVERLVVAASSAIQALSDPTNAGAVARFGEATGDRALRRIYHQMLQDPVGSRLLREKPRINTATLPAECVRQRALSLRSRLFILPSRAFLWRRELRALPDGSLGREYLAYCELHGFSADERPPVT